MQIQYVSADCPKEAGSLNLDWVQPSSSLCPSFFGS